jgi:hypothetical protein
LLDVNNNVIASKAIVWEVDRPGVTDDATVSESDVPLLREAIEAAGRAENAADEAAATLANFAEVVAEQVEQMQIHEGQTVIDGTLTVSGAAADAKVTGDKLATFAVVNDASGDIVALSDGADDLPFKSVAVNIAPLQSGSGDPSPTNVRPISGWTAVNVVRVGKNLLPKRANGSSNGITCTVNQDNSITLTGTATGNTTFPIIAWSSFMLPLLQKSGTKFTVSGGVSTSLAIYVQVRRNNTTQNETIARSMETAETFVVSDNVTNYSVYVRIDKDTTVNDTIYPQLELGSTATSYEPNTEQTYSVTIPTEAGTVYGGTLDVVKGTLTVDRRYIPKSEISNAKSGSSQGNIQYANAGCFVYDVIDAERTNSATKNTKLIATTLPTKSQDVLNNGGSGGVLGCAIWWSRNIGIGTGDTSITNFTGFKTWWENNGGDIVYPLAEPTTYTLTPTEIRTLLGNNTLWADAGAVDVQYPADTKLYIDGKIAELQALVLENA